MPSLYALWVPAIILYTMIVALTISFFGAAINVYYRDMSQALPIALSLLMYGSPVMYPLSLVHQKLIVEQAAGKWSNGQMIFIPFIHSTRWRELSTVFNV
jgi:lipopolysaccharide transport system permease protein